MWFFIDESWSPKDSSSPFGLLSGVLVEESKLPDLDRFLFQVRKKYYGSEHARDYTRDLKGNTLLSNAMIRMWSKIGSMPNNICVVKEMLTYPTINPEIYFKTFASFIYSSNGELPDLLNPDPKKLATPIKSIIENVSMAATEHNPDASVKLIFDQRLGAQEGLAIAMRHFIAGIGLKNIHPYPYFAVSNICPGIQFADVFAYLLSRRAQKVKELFPLYKLWMGHQWQSPVGATPHRYGLGRWNESTTASGDRRYTVRNSW